MRNALELLLEALLSRKANFGVVFTRMKPIITYEDEFSLAFFIGYVAHSYKQLFLILQNRDMQYDEVSDVLDFLMRNRTRIRESLTGRPSPMEIGQIPKKEAEVRPVEVIRERVADIRERVVEMELSIAEIRRDIKVIEEAAREEITRYEMQLVKSGKFAKSVLSSR